MSFGISGYIEEASKRASSRTSGRKSVHTGGYPTRGNMDFMDHGEIDHMKYEHDLTRHHKRKFLTAQEVIDGEQLGQIGAIDFRDLIRESECGSTHFQLVGEPVSMSESCECDRASGEACIVCCTKFDLEAYPIMRNNPSVTIGPRRGWLDEFQVRMPVVLAEALGMLGSA